MKLSVLVAVAIALVASEAFARRPGRGGGRRGSVQAPSRPNLANVRPGGGGGAPTLAPSSPIRLSLPGVQSGPRIPGISGLQNDVRFPAAGNAATIAPNRPGRTDFQRHLEGFSPQQGTLTGDVRAQWQQQAAQVRAGLQGQYDNLFTPQWYLDHPNAWQATHPYADVAAVTAFVTVAAWVGTATQPVVYDYFTTGSYEDGTQTQEAFTLAETGQAVDQADSEWLSLGVFALVRAQHTDAHAMIQIAVNKQGVVRGTYFDVLSNIAQPIQGAVDQRTQRVAFTVGDSAETVLETALSDLTKDEAPVLVHRGTTEIQNWFLVRVQPDTGATD